MVANFNKKSIEDVALEKETGIWFSGEDVRNAYIGGEVNKWYESQQNIFIFTKVLSTNIDINKYVQIRFINGNAEAPIFGFDAPSLSYSDPRFIFTKTYRHLEQAASHSEFVPDNSFQNAFVYGHSLSRNDYNYFFPILDHLNMTDINAYNNRICFAYSVYSKKKEESIKKEFLNSVGKLIESYADYKGIKEKSRLLDQLSVSGKIFIYEVGTNA